MTVDRALSDDEAVAQCYARYGDRLLKYLYKISQSKEVAEDISQDVWLRVTEIRKARYSGSTHKPVIGYSEGVPADTNTCEVAPMNNMRAQDVTEIKQPGQQWAYLAKIGLNKYLDWYRKKRPVSLEELAARIFPDASERDAEENLADKLARTEIFYTRLRQLHDSYEAVLAAFARDNSPVHQTIVFGFNRPLQWEPMEIVQEHSSKTLDQLGLDLKTGVSEAFALSPEGSRTIFSGMQKRLQQSIDWEHVKAHRAGTTILTRYFKKNDSKGRAKETTQWSLAVQRRIIKQLLAVTAAPVRSKGRGINEKIC
jgi:DNA-directed RNA polymerase specialized sigma24 family protein